MDKGLLLLLHFWRCFRIKRIHPIDFSILKVDSGIKWVNPVRNGLKKISDLDRVLNVAGST
jgi:hypothetical protein